MANGRIDVYFHNSSGDDGASQEENQESVDGKSTAPKKNKNDTARSAVASMAIGYAKRAANYGISIYGDLSGDYQRQTAIQEAVSTAGTLIMMANFPVGTIAGAFSIATQTANTIIQNNKMDRDAAMYQKRTGNETINNSEAD